MGFSLYGWNVGAGTLALDYVLLLPAKNFRILKTLGTSYVTKNEVVWDDSVNYLSYTANISATIKRFNIIPQGDTIRLFPGVKQRLYFTFVGYAGACGIGNDFNVTLNYRPRRLTL
jgi:hypothetical protein